MKEYDAMRSDLSRRSAESPDAAEDSCRNHKVSRLLIRSGSQHGGSRKDPQIEPPLGLRRCEAALEAGLRAFDNAIERACPCELGYEGLLRERRLAAKLLNAVRLDLQLLAIPEDRRVAGRLVV